MRHGIAEPLSEEVGSDFTRPLSAEGRDRTAKAARGLVRLVPSPGALISSPKTRARQTAQFVRDAFGKKAPPLVEWPELAEDSPQGWTAKLRTTLGQSECGTVLLVGHEPTLSQFVALALTGDESAMALDFKKAGVCALDYDLESGRAVLLWFLTPKALRRLAP